MVVIKQNHIAACQQTWKSCERLLLDLQLIKAYLAKEVLTTIDECAHVSMATYYAFKSGSVNSEAMALLCIGLCEECAEVCSGQVGTGFDECATACRDCANTLSDFTLSQNEG